MKLLVGALNKAQDLLGLTRHVDFLAPLMLRIYLVPVFYFAAINKWNPLAAGGTYNPFTGLADIAAWFGNPDWGLGLPAPMLMAFLAWSAEYFGAIALALGVAVRWVCLPLIFTMVVAITSVHWDHGWQAVHDPKSPYAAADIDGAIERLDRARSILREHGHYDWLTARGNFVISNNGIEWAATYLVMLVALFFLGAGRFFSVDHWLAQRFRARAQAA